MKKKIVSVMLVAGMIAGLCAGCGGTEQAAGTEAAATTGSSAEESAEASSLDFGGTELIIKMPNCGGPTEGNDAVVEKINEITSEKLNLTVNVEWIGLADYAQNMNLMFSSQETCDLMMCTPLNNYASMRGQDELMDISAYLDTYGQDIEAISPDYLKAYTDGDAVYGIPTNREKAGAFYVHMRTDILEELGLTEQAESMTCWSDYYAILDVVKEAHPELAAEYFSASGNTGIFLDGCADTSAENFSEGKALDNLGDANNLVYIDEDGNVASYYESDSFYNCIKRSQEIYEKGYVNTDAITCSDDAGTDCKNGKCFSWVGAGESDEEATAELNSGCDLTVVKICPESATTFLTTLWGFAVPYTSENPEAAVAFMNLMYTDSELANLFAWGIEGTDYEVNSDGYAQYIDGTDATYHSMTWEVGNSLVLTPWTGGSTSEEEETFMAEEEKSQYLGFLADTSELEQTMTACANVINEYRDQLYVGCAGTETDALYQEMCDKLQAAGINDIVTAYQEQLDAWEAEQN